MPIAYLATPYTHYPGGIESAFVHACQLAARLIKTGTAVYSPIAHCHPIAVNGDLDPKDQTFWYDFNQSMLAAADVLIVAHMDGWESSTGVAHEIEYFEAAGKPIFDLDVNSLAMIRRKGA
jgi:nucleoside 2-deoxyribosyltransferase